MGILKTSNGMDFSEIFTKCGGATVCGVPYDLHDVIIQVPSE